MRTPDPDASELASVLVATLTDEQLGMGGYGMTTETLVRLVFEEVQVTP